MNRGLWSRWNTVGLRLHRLSAAVDRLAEWCYRRGRRRR